MWDNIDCFDLLHAGFIEHARLKEAMNKGFRQAQETAKKLKGSQRPMTFEEWNRPFTI